jgi:hypothetical protein
VIGVKLAGTFLNRRHAERFNLQGLSFCGLKYSIGINKETENSYLGVAKICQQVRLLSCMSF